MRPGPFIVITAFPSERTRAEAYRLGAHAVFDKAFDLEEPRSSVNALAGHL